MESAYKNDVAAAKRLFSQNVNALVRHYQDAHPNMTLADLADQIGISPRTLRNARTAAHAATLDTVQSVASFFGLDVWQLFLPDLPAEILLNPRTARMVRNVVRAAIADRVDDLHVKRKTRSL